MDAYQDFLQANLVNLFVQHPNDLYTDVHLSHDGLEIFSVSSQHQQWVSVSDCYKEPTLAMHFSMEGLCLAEQKHCSSLSALQKNQHALTFSPSFEGNYSIRGTRINCFGVSMSQRYFKRLMINDLDCLQRFWEKASRHEEVDIAPTPLFITPEQKALIFELRDCDYTGEMRNLFYESKIVELFLLQALQAEGWKGNKLLTMPSNDQDRLYEAKEFIERNLLEPLSIKQICSAVGLNDFKLKKGFKELFGTTVFEYLGQLRMQHARKLLLDTAHSVFEVAYALGYSEPYNFTKAFKKHFGYLPSKLKSY